MNLENQKLFGRGSITLVALTTLLAVALLFWLEAEIRLGAILGVVTASLATASALFLLKVTINSTLKKVLFGVAGGFFCRMLLVAVGMVLAKNMSADVLAFCVAFFSLYFSHQAIEIAAILRRSRNILVEGKA